MIRLATLAAVTFAVVASCEGRESGAPPEADDPAAFSGRVTRVVDGDTFWLDTQPVSIRVFGLDAPERGTVGGPAATAALRRLIAGKTVSCRVRDVDRYSRIVGQCGLPDGRDIAAAMIASGTATEYCRYSGNHYGTC